MPKILNTEQKDKLLVWLDKHHINTNKMHREYSDGAAMAYLLKKLFPKLVDIHNYPQTCNLQQKIINWELLQKKVFNKLKIELRKSTIAEIAAGVPNALNEVFYKVMLAEEAAQKKPETAEQQQEQMWAENEEIMVVNINQIVGDAIVKVPQKMILYSIYEQAVNELKEKEAYLAEAEQRVQHLEKMLALKSERIEELSQHVNKSSCTTSNHKSSIQS